MLALSLLSIVCCFVVVFMTTAALQHIDQQTMNSSKMATNSTVASKYVPNSKLHNKRDRARNLRQKLSTFIKYLLIALLLFNVVFEFVLISLRIKLTVDRIKTQRTAKMRNDKQELRDSAVNSTTVVGASSSSHTYRTMACVSLSLLSSIWCMFAIYFMATTAPRAAMLLTMCHVINAIVFSSHKCAPNLTLATAHTCSAFVLLVIAVIVSGKGKKMRGVVGVAN